MTWDDTESEHFQELAALVERALPTPQLSGPNVLIDEVDLPVHQQ